MFEFRSPEGNCQMRMIHCAVPTHWLELFMWSCSEAEEAGEPACGYCYGALGTDLLAAEARDALFLVQNRPLLSVLIQTHCSCGTYFNAVAAQRTLLPVNARPDFKKTVEHADKGAGHRPEIVY